MCFPDYSCCLVVVGGRNVLYGEIMQFIVYQLIMSKCTQSSTNLSSYLRFFRILTDMEEHQTLESPEKRMLKTRFTL